MKNNFSYESDRGIMKNNFGRDLKIAVFSYNFPHYKSMMGLVYLCSQGHYPEMVFLQDKKPLKHHQSILRYTPRSMKAIPDTVRVCRALGLNHMKGDHNSPAVISKVKEGMYDIGIILGARILSEELISAFQMGIINMHPGLLPENRGLDNHKWAIVEHLKQGVTLHFIDEEIDRGSIIVRVPINVYLDDSLVDIHLRLQDEERRLLIYCINEFYRTGTWGAIYRAVSKGVYHGAMSTYDDVKVLENFDFYKQYYDHMEERFEEFANPTYDDDIVDEEEQKPTAKQFGD